MARGNDSKVMDFPFTTGLRQDLETDLMVPGGLLRAQNVEFVKPGRLAKREAFEAVGTGQHSKEYSYLGDVRRLLTGPGGERLICTDENIYTQFEATDDLAEAGAAGIRCNVAASLQQVFTAGADTGGTISSAQCAVVGDWLWVSWIQRDTISSAYMLFASVVSISTGSRAWSSQLIDELSVEGLLAPHRALAIGNYVYVFYAKTSATTIVYQAYDLSAATLGPVGSPTTLVTDAQSIQPLFDVTVSGSGTNVALLYNSTSSVLIRTYTSSGGVLLAASGPYDWGTAASPNLVAPTSLCIASGTNGTRGIAAIANSTTSTTELVTLSQSLVQSAIASVNDAATFGGATKQVSVELVSTLDWLFATSRVTATDPQNPLGHVWSKRYTDLLTSGDGWAPFANYIIGSRFYRDPLDGGRVFALQRFSATGQTHLLLADWGRDGANLPYPVLSVASGVAPLVTAATSPYIAAVAAGSTADHFFISVVKNLTGEGVNGGQNVVTYRFRARGHDRYLDAPALESSVLAGGTPLLFDGSRVVEMGFYSFPGGALVDATPSTTGGLIEQGTYQYCFVYEWNDSYGNRHQSAPSLPVSIDLSAGGYSGDTASVAWSLPVLHATRKQHRDRNLSSHYDQSSPVKIVAYRTDQGGLPPFKRAMRTAYPPSVANNVASHSPVTWTDTAADSALGEALYTDAGVLAGTIGPASVIVANFAGRIWGVMAERPDTLWCTRVMSSGTIPTPAAEFTIPVPGAGRVNALVPQDGKLYALCDRGVWIASYGEGPTDTGQGAFPEPVFLTATANCTDPRGAVATQDGLFFTGRDQFGTGIYWMRRGEQTPQPIGRRVSAELAACPVVKGAVDRTSKSRVELLIADADDSPTDTRIVYYHYDVPDETGIGAFTVATYLPAELECVGLWNDVTAIGASGAGIVSTQTGLLYRDIDAAAADYEIPLVIETGDARPFGILGYGQVDAIVLLATLAAPSNLRFEASFDSGATYIAAEWLKSTFTGAAGTVVIRHWEASVKKTELSALRLRFSDIDISGVESAAGVLWHGFALELAQLGGTTRLSNAERR